MESMIEHRQKLAERDLAIAWPQWKIVRLLGTGSFGEVYEIHREEYGRVFKCALKIIRKENPAPTPGDLYVNISSGNNSEEFIETVLREIDIMEKLKGASNIVVIDDYTVVRNSDSNSVLIRMELLTNLGEYIMTRQISMNDILKIGIDICNALDYCEQQNIIHRDVKESNIFYSGMGDFKLGDFGISRQLSNYLINSGTMTAAGTVNKMAPEVYIGQQYDNRVDIYSLGMVLYSLLNYGRSPFYPPYPEPVTAEDSYSANLSRLKGTPIPPLQGVDRKLNKIICKACDAKPSGRYRTASEFREALLDYYEEINGTNPGGIERRPETKNTLLYAAAIIAIISIAAGATGFWYVNSQDNKQIQRYAYEAPENDHTNVHETTAGGNADPESDKTGNLEQSTEKKEDSSNGQSDNEQENDNTEEEYHSSSDALSIRFEDKKEKEIDEEPSPETDQEGNLLLKDDNGNSVVRVSSPDWSEYSSLYSYAAIFMSSMKDLYIYYADVDFSASYYINMERVYYASENDNIMVDSLTEVTEYNSDWQVYWFAVNYRYIHDDGEMGSFNTKYFAAIPCSHGILEIEATKSAGENYEEYPLEEFLEDLSIIELVE